MDNRCEGLAYMPRQDFFVFFSIAVSFMESTRLIFKEQQWFYSFLAEKSADVANCAENKVILWEQVIVVGEAPILLAIMKCHSFCDVLMSISKWRVWLTQVYVLLQTKQNFSA